jgi:hypothetical protein
MREVIHHMTIGTDKASRQTSIECRTWSTMQGYWKQCMSNWDANVLKMKIRKAPQDWKSSHQGRSKEGKQISSIISRAEDQIAKSLPKASFTRDQETYWGDITWDIRKSEVAECITNITLKWRSVSIQVLKQCSFGIGPRPQDVRMGQAEWHTVII